MATSAACYWNVERNVSRSFSPKDIPGICGPSDLLSGYARPDVLGDPPIPRSIRDDIHPNHVIKVLLVEVVGSECYACALITFTINGN